MSEQGQATLEASWDFDPAGREEYQVIMRLVSYSELPEYKAIVEFLKDNDRLGGYWCATCPWFSEDPSSVTGYRCKKYGFPDQPWGCSVGWEKKE